MDNLFGGSNLKFASVTLITWLLAMAFVYALKGRDAINVYSAIAALFAPLAWIAFRALKQMLQK